jgi:two-component sensor histidine kinase
MQSNPKKALETIRKAAPYIGTGTPESTLENYLLNTAHYFRDMSVTDSALYYYGETEKLNNKFFPYENWVVYEGIAGIFAEKFEWDKAEAYYLKGYAITKAGTRRSDHGIMLFMLANLYVLANKPEKFTPILNEYEAFISVSRRNLLQDPVHTMLFLDWGKYSLEQKVDFLEKAKKKNRENGYEEGVAECNFYLSGAYEEAKQYDKALGYLLENNPTLLTDKDLYLKYANLRHIYRIQKKANMQDAALKTGEDILLVSAKLSDVNSKEIALNLEKKYETEKKQKEIALLNSNNELANKEIALLNSQKELDSKAFALLNSQKRLIDIELLRQLDIRQSLARENELIDSVLIREKAYSLSVTRERQKEAALNAALGRENALKAGELKKEKNLRQVLIAGAALLLLAGVIILFQYKRQKAKSIVIQRQADDLQVLMKEIHHRVKNNLQVISSLLDLQSMTISDNQASEAVKEGKNRVQSMALIHQNLYSEGNIKGIKTKEYINNLLQSLCDSYNITNDKVIINAQIDDLNLDVDTMIPLGLVLNELVSNALKYAFKDGRKGELSIVLREEARHLLLKVSDNGTGYPEGINVREGKSFGMKMIRAFAQKLKAKLEVYNNNGAVVEMQITKYNLA